MAYGLTGFFYVSKGLSKLSNKACTIMRSQHILQIKKIMIYSYSLEGLFATKYWTIYQRCNRIFLKPLYTYVISFSHIFECSRHKRVLLYIVVTILARQGWLT